MLIPNIHVKSQPGSTHQNPSDEETEKTGSIARASKPRKSIGVSETLSQKLREKVIIAYPVSNSSLHTYTCLHTHL